MIQEFTELVRAGFSGIWVQTDEPMEVLRDMMLWSDSDPHRRFAAWDVDKGLAIGGGSPQRMAPTEALAKYEVVKPDDPTGNGVLVMLNLHKQLQGAQVLQALQNSLHECKGIGVSVVVIAPHAQVPEEVKHQFRILSPGMPDSAALSSVLDDVIAGQPDLETLDDEQRNGVLEAASGLTRGEAENAFALSLIRHRAVQGAPVWDTKALMLHDSSSLELYRGEASFDELGGLGAMKSFVQRSLANRESEIRPKGIMLVGVPGSGKSQFCKAAGAGVGLPVVQFDVASCFGSLVGQTEANIRRALDTAEAMAPCVLMIDEVEKALAGGSGRSQGDSGVSSRLLGTLLTWLSDHESLVYTVVTANDVEALPPEFGRAERFDALFFVDLPDADTKQTIWSMYRGKYGLPEQELPWTDQWTGAEIQQCCRTARLLDCSIVESAEYISPVAKTYGEKMDGLRRWAQERCIDANRGGSYQVDGAASVGGVRKVGRRTSK